MDAPVVTSETTMKEYRKAYAEKFKEWMSPENIAELREGFIKVVDVVIAPRLVDMKEFNGLEEDMREKIEYLYANDGRQVWSFIFKRRSILIINQAPQSEADADYATQYDRQIRQRLYVERPRHILL
jgi:hypothetical protein